MKRTSRFWRSRRPASSAALASPRRDTRLTPEQSPQRVGIDAQVPDSVPRAEDDAITRARSPEFYDRPGSASGTATRTFRF